jgi:hypothetical protein
MAAENSSMKGIPRAAMILNFQLQNFDAGDINRCPSATRSVPLLTITQTERRRARRTARDKNWERDTRVRSAKSDRSGYGTTDIRIGYHIFRNEICFQICWTKTSRWKGFFVNKTEFYSYILKQKRKINRHYKKERREYMVYNKWQRSLSEKIIWNQQKHDLLRADSSTHQKLNSEWTHHRNEFHVIMVPMVSKFLCIRLVLTILAVCFRSVVE